MEREDLLNALRLVKNHCADMEDCQLCIIYEFCDKEFKGLPENWKLDDV